MSDLEPHVLVRPPKDAPLTVGDYLMTVEKWNDGYKYAN